MIGWKTKILLRNRFKKVCQDLIECLKINLRRFNSIFFNSSSNNKMTHLNMIKFQFYFFLFKKFFYINFIVETKVTIAILS